MLISNLVSSLVPLFGYFVLLVRALTRSGNCNLTASGFEQSDNGIE